MSPDDLGEDLGRDVPAAQAGAVDHRAPLDVGAERAVARDLDARGEVGANAVGDQLGPLEVDVGRRRRRERAVGAADREILPGCRADDAVVVVDRSLFVRRNDVGLRPGLRVIANIPGAIWRRLRPSISACALLAEAAYRVRLPTCARRTAIRCLTSVFGRGRSTGKCRELLVIV